MQTPTPKQKEKNNTQNANFCDVNVNYQVLDSEKPRPSAFACLRWYIGEKRVLLFIAAVFWLLR